MSEPIIFNLDCKFCGAELRLEIDRSEIPAEGKKWIEAHAACAGGEEGRIDVTGQTDEHGPMMPILSAIVKT
jgi:hypothetical protein